jgi:hypothetical protein
MIWVTATLAYYQCRSCFARLVGLRGLRTAHCILNYMFYQQLLGLFILFALTLSKLIQRIKTFGMRRRVPAKPSSDFQHIARYSSLEGVARLGIK